MFQIIFNEIATWPQFLQKIFSYLQKATVVVPVMAILGYVGMKERVECTLTSSTQI